MTRAKWINKFQQLKNHDYDNLNRLVDGTSNIDLLYQLRDYLIERNSSDEYGQFALKNCNHKIEILENKAEAELKIMVQNYNHGKSAC